MTYLTKDRQDEPATARKTADADGYSGSKGGAPLVSLTAYTTPMATKGMDGICDFVLVGFSGDGAARAPSTLEVTMR